MQTQMERRALLKVFNLYLELYLRELYQFKVGAYHRFYREQKVILTNSKSNKFSGEIQTQSSIKYSTNKTD